MIVARVLERWSERTGRDTRHCHAEGCKKATTGRKPFCVDHVEMLAYVQGLQERIASREAEWLRVGRLGPRAVDVAGLTAQEIIHYLHVHGPCTVRRLAKDLAMERSLLDSYVSAFATRGMVEISENNRGVCVLTMLAEGDAVLAKGDPAAAPRAA